MPDRPKSSTHPSDPPVESTQEPSGQADRSPSPESQPRSGDDKPCYSIRVTESPGTLCATCRKEPTGAGPVGYLNGDPICDLCLLEGNAVLGMVLALVAVCRAFASLRGTLREEYEEAVRELAAFARVYHRLALKTWPARILRVPRSTIEAKRARPRKEAGA